MTGEERRNKKKITRSLKKPVPVKKKLINPKKIVKLKFGILNSIFHSTFFLF
jgi:hypothetical protein